MASRLGLRQLSELLGGIFQRERNERENDEIVAVGDFCIDLRSHEVSVRGHEVELDSEEFDMLVFLAGHPRRVVTPRTLLSTRWGEHEVRQSDFVRVLTSLRKKLEPAGGSAHYIRTEPWIFYRFDPSSLTAG